MEETKLAQVEVGEHVVYVDEKRHYHNALITAVWGEVTHGVEPGGNPWVNYPCINLLYVVDAPEQQDQYGRQIERTSSVVHFSSQTAPGFSWMYEHQREEAKEHFREAGKGLKV